MSDVDSFLSSLQAAYRTSDLDEVAALLDPLDLHTREQLSLSLKAAPHLRPSSYASLTKTFFSDNPQFADLVASYLLFVRDSQAAFSSEQPETALNAFELFSSCYSAAIVVLAGQDSAWFVPTLRKLANALSTLAFQADEASEDTKHTQAGLAARLLSRSLSISAAERSNEWPSKRNAVFFLANQTLKIYFRLNNLRLCDTVVKNTRDARDFLETQYPKADQVTFAYYMGRMYLYQRRMRKAMVELRKAFDLCSNAQSSNKRLILIYLVTASLPLGTLPSEELLAEFDLHGQYAGLVQAVKCGNYQACLASLDTWQTWHLRRGTYLVLRDKLELVCWRNLARKTLLISQAMSPMMAGPPVLNLNTLLTAARYAFKDASLDVDDIEAMCASLLDQGYLKAYIQQERGLLVLQRGEQLGFPPISSVRMAGDDA